MTEEHKNSRAAYCRKWKEANRERVRAWSRKYQRQRRISNPISQMQRHKKRASNRDYYLNNRRKKIEYQKEYVKHNSRSDYMRKYYLANRQRSLATARVWRLNNPISDEQRIRRNELENRRRKLDPEKFRQKQINWHRANPTKRSERARRYYWSNPELFRERARHNLENRDSIRQGARLIQKLIALQSVSKTINQQTESAL